MRDRLTDQELQEDLRWLAAKPGRVLHRDTARQAADRIAALGNDNARILKQKDDQILGLMAGQRKTAGELDAAIDLLARSKVDGGVEWDRTAPGNRERYLEVARLEVAAAAAFKAAGLDVPCETVGGDDGYGPMCKTHKRPHAYCLTDRERYAASTGGKS